MPNRIIDQERQGLWISVAFIIAIFALVLSFINMQRTQALAAMTQIQVLAIDKRIDGMAKKPVVPENAAPDATESH